MTRLVRLMVTLALAAGCADVACAQAPPSTPSVAIVATDPGLSGQLGGVFLTAEAFFAFWSDDWLRILVAAAVGLATGVIVYGGLSRVLTKDEGDEFEPSRTIQPNRHAIQNRVEERRMRAGPIRN